LTSQVVVPKGLEDVVVAESKLSYVYGKVGRLIYRGYDIFDLAEHSTFEETAYLMLHGDLPNPQQLADFTGTLAENRELPQDVINRVLRCLPSSAHPMDALRSVVSTLGIFDPETSDNSNKASLSKAVRLIAKTPTVVAAFHRIRSGNVPLAPNRGLSHAANFLYMLHGKPADDRTTRVFDICLMLHVDHGFNASTFAARVAASTLTDIYGAVTAAVATLKGPLHGGANERVMEMLEEIGGVDGTEEYVNGKLREGVRIMGFGHRVYKTEDPRATVLRRLAQEVWERKGDLQWVQRQTRMENLMLREKRLYPNVDFYSATVYKALGIPRDLYTPIFAMARMAGWTSHVTEQYNDNRLIRPRAEYTGETGRTYIPIGRR
jgi:2-methylcitrate synthase